LTYTGNGRFVCVGAHEWPLLYRGQTKRCETIETPGPWLGIVLDLPEIPVTVLTVETGDVLCLYSDGVTEAQAPLSSTRRGSAVLRGQLVH
jgi:serine phosphatase RsbU (regulator of sigma subunit)